MDEGVQLNLLADDGAARRGLASSRPDDTSRPGDTVRLRFLIAYLGTNFHGLAPQPKHRTVGGEFLRALTTSLHLDVTPVLGMSGRTDAGVHAFGQVVHVDVASTTKVHPARLQRSLRKMLEPEIVVRSIDIAPPGFDARHSARWRRYRYTIHNAPEADPFRTQTVWHVREPLDLAAMRLACDPLIGEHDFSSFCRSPKLGPDDEPASMVRRLTDASWLDLRESEPGILRFEVQASSFCQQMVRAIVGLMVDIGKGNRTAGDVLGIIRARNRAASAPIAPPQGLCLCEVGYDPVDQMAAIRSAASSATANVAR